MNIRDLQIEAHAIAKAKGWYDTERSFGDQLERIHSALSKAGDAYLERDSSMAWMPEPWPDGSPALWQDTKGNPVGVASELAEVVIRVADIAEGYNWELDLLDEDSKRLFHQEPSRLNGLDIFGYWVTKCHAELSMAFSMMEHHASNYHRDDLPVVTGWVMAQFVVMIQQMAAHYGIDLDDAIEAKMEYNKTHPYRHEGKAL